ncbi:MAG: hypothetical protein SGPRY_010100 [Prymnesium sp.]
MACECAAARLDARASNALCASPPPRVAHCIAGAARTFPEQRAWRSLRRNLVEAFGGVGLSSDSPDVFFQMKLLDDAPKAQREWSFSPINHASALPALCDAACAFSPRGLSLLNASHAGPLSPPARARGCFTSGFFANPHNLARAVSQWSSFAGCLTSLADAEAEARAKYDVVVLTRPDCVWYGAVRPFCQHDLGRTSVHRGPARWNSTLEWLLIMPRAQAEVILSAGALFERCQPQQRCCSISRSEDLLRHALLSAGPYEQLPFGVDILRPAHHAHMRNAGCSQPEVLGFRSFEHCRAIILLTPSVHQTIRTRYWGGVGGRGILFARLYDVQTLPPTSLTKLLCVLAYMARGEGEWSAPSLPGKAMPPAAETAGCRFHPSTELSKHSYMAQSLSRQLSTLRLCFERLILYERKRGLRFEWILRTRTDTAFFSPAQPHCSLPPAVLTAHAYSKGENTVHMFSDHAAIIPRDLARTFFISIADRLARCAATNEQLPLRFGAPESFVHHTLLEGGVRVEHAEWLQPFVISIDGRMTKWCDRCAE